MRGTALVNIDTDIHVKVLVTKDGCEVLDLGDNIHANVSKLNDIIKITQVKGVSQHEHRRIRQRY